MFRLRNSRLANGSSTSERRPPRQIESIRQQISWMLQVPSIWLLQVKTKTRPTPFLWFPFISPTLWYTRKVLHEVIAHQKKSPVLCGYTPPVAWRILTGQWYLRPMRYRKVAIFVPSILLCSFGEQNLQKWHPNSTPRHRRFMNVPGPVIGYGWHWSANVTISHGQLYVALSRADKAAQTLDETTRTESQKDSIDNPGLENIICLFGVVRVNSQQQPYRLSPISLLTLFHVSAPS